MAPIVPHHRRGTGGDAGLPTRSASSSSLNCSSTALADNDKFSNPEARDVLTFTASPINRGWDRKSDQEAHALIEQNEAFLPFWAFTFSFPLLARKLR